MKRWEEMVEASQLLIAFEVDRVDCYGKCAGFAGSKDTILNELEKW